MEGEPDETSRRSNYAPLLVASVLTIAIVMVGVVLQATAVLFVPLTFALFIALLVEPLDSAVRSRVPDWLGWAGHAAAMSVVLSVLLAVMGGVYLSGKRLVQVFTESNGPDENGNMESAAEAGIENVEGMLSQFGMNIDQFETVAREFLNSGFSEFAMNTASRTGHVVLSFILVFFITLLILIEVPLWRRKAATISDDGSAATLIRATGKVAVKLRRYILVRAVLGVVTAVLYVLWLWIFGVDLLLVWGLLTFALNFIPTIGSLISGTLAALYAFITRDFQTALWVAAGLFVIEQVMGNFIDPRVQGQAVALSPIVILLSLIFWGTMWGIPGTFIGVPLTLAIMILLYHYERTRWMALLLSNQSDERELGKVIKE